MLGLMTHGFPNLFMVTGPGSPSAIGNVVVSIEQHVDWIADCITYLRANKVSRMDANLQAENDWMEHVNATAAKTLFPTCEHSWYMGANIPGKPRVFMPYLGGIGTYRRECDEIAKAGYKGFELTSK
jgi:cyclohexanone monooxygenase